MNKKIVFGTVGLAALGLTMVPTAAQAATDRPFTDPGCFELELPYEPIPEVKAPSQLFYCHAVPGVPAVGEEFLQVEATPYIPESFIEQPNPDYVPAVTAVGEPTLEVPNPDYVPAGLDNEIVVQHPAVTETQWKYAQNKGNGFLWLNYYAHGKIDVNGKTYQATSHTKTVVVSEAWTETVVTPGLPAVGEPTLVVDNPDYVPASEAVGEPTIQVRVPEVPATYNSVPNPDYVPAIPGKPGYYGVIHNPESETPATEVVPVPEACEGLTDNPDSVFLDNCWLKTPPAELAKVCAEDPTWWECELLIIDPTKNVDDVVVVPVLNSQPSSEVPPVSSQGAIVAPQMSVPGTLAETGSSAPVPLMAGVAGALALVGGALTLMRRGKRSV